MRNIDKDSHWWLVISLIMLLVVIFLTMTFTGCTDVEVGDDDISDDSGMHSVEFYVRSEPAGIENTVDEFHIQMTMYEDELHTYEETDVLFEADVADLDQEGEVRLYTLHYEVIEGVSQGLEVTFTADGIHTSTIRVFFHNGESFYKEVHFNVMEQDGYFNIDTEYIIE